jgi:hypothetical protein
MVAHLSVPLPSVHERQFIQSGALAITSPESVSVPLPSLTPDSWSCCQGCVYSAAAHSGPCLSWQGRCHCWQSPDYTLSMCPCQSPVGLISSKMKYPVGKRMFLPYSLASSQDGNGPTQSSLPPSMKTTTRLNMTEPIHRLLRVAGM